MGIPYAHTYLSGPKVGTTETRHRWETVTQSFPRLYEPIKGSELKKPGFWSTDEATLKTLKGNKDLIKLLLKRAEMEKWLGTYLKGIPKKHREMDWPGDIVHGTFNQCGVITGRLSSSKPNLQNLDPRINEYIITRFA